MQSRELIKELRSQGFEHAGGKGSHRKLKHKGSGKHVTVPHPVKDLPVGTLSGIRKQAANILKQTEDDASA